MLIVLIIIWDAFLQVAKPFPHLDKTDQLILAPWPFWKLSLNAWLLQTMRSYGFYSRWPSSTFQSFWSTRVRLTRQVQKSVSSLYPVLKIFQRVKYTSSLYRCLWQMCFVTIFVLPSPPARSTACHALTIDRENPYDKTIFTCSASVHAVNHSVQAIVRLCLAVWDECPNHVNIAIFFYSSDILSWCYKTGHRLVITWFWTDISKSFLQWNLDNTSTTCFVQLLLPLIFSFTSLITVGANFFCFSVSQGISVITFIYSLLKSHQMIKVIFGKHSWAVMTLCLK